jgi:hypothetical protein
MMQRYVFILLVLASVVLVGWDKGIAQIPNASFENWSGGDPVGWNTSNSPPSVINVTQSSDAHAGTSSIAGSVISVSGFPFGPVIIAGSDGTGFPVNTQQPALHGWYKFTSVSSDNFLVNIAMINADSGVGGGSFVSTTTQSVYKEFVLNISYLYPTIPDTCQLTATIVGSGGVPHIGSTFVIDDLSFGAVTSVDDKGNLIPNEFALLQNYPNPFNPTTMIQYALPHAANVHLGVYDLLGKEVATLVDGHQDAGSYRAELHASQLPSGIYFYRLQAGQFSEVRKLVLLK